MSKILLVEDDNNLREIYEARLQAEGYNIVAAHDGEEALVVAKGEMPDLIISDVMMPKISGFEMLDILRNTEGLKEVKVIMLTALGQNDDQQRADKLGADRYLVKSQVTLEDIVKAADEILNPKTADDTPVEMAVPEAVTSQMTNPVTNTAATTVPEPVTPEPVVATPIPEPITVNPAPAPEPSQGPPVISMPVTEATTVPTLPDSPTIDVVVPPADPANINDDLINNAINDLNASSQSDVNAVLTPPATQIPVTEPAAISSDITASANNEASALDDEISKMEEQIKDFTNTKPTGPDAAVSAPVDQPVVDLPTEAIAEQAAKSGGNKVIEPISQTEVKPDINDLIAKEEAKETAANSNPMPAATTQAPAPTPTPDPVPVATTPAPTAVSAGPTQPATTMPAPAPESPAPAAGAPDPNAIAL